MSASVRTLQRRIDRIKQELMVLGDLRPGHLSEQYNVCGNPRCRCKATPPQKHGPYFQLAWTRKAKSTTRFIRKPDVPAVKEQLRNYEQMQTLLEQWVDAALQICEIKLNQSRTASKASRTA